MPIAMSMIRRFLTVFALVGALAGAAVAQQNPVGPTTPLTIVSGTTTHNFQVELADTPEKSELGLMNRTSMEKDHGMIFDFGEPRDVSMWMKNTLIPLDMLFIDTDGTVLAIAQNARPGSLRLIGSGFPIKSVLELNGGVAKELGLKPGDKVEHKIFKSATDAKAPAKVPAKANGG
jgi:uncharacterized protein